MNLFKVLRVLREIASKRDLGPTPAFGEIHIMEAIMLLGSESPIGRLKLSKKLMLGESSARTILKHLKTLGLVEASRRGYSLTRKGKRLYSFIRERILGPIEVEKNTLAFGDFNIAFLVKAAAEAVRLGLEQRDAAVRVGGLGAITLIFKDGRLVMPGVEGCTSEIVEVEKLVKSNFKLEEGDVVILGAGRSLREAELAAKAAVLETLRRLKG